MLSEEIVKIVLQSEYNNTTTTPSYSRFLDPKTCPWFYCFSIKLRECTNVCKHMVGHIITS